MWFRRALPWLFALAIAANLLELASMTVLGWNSSVAGIESGFALEGVDNKADIAVSNHYRAPVPGKSYVLVRHDNGRTIYQTVIARPSPIGSDQIARLAGVFWVLLFASLIYLKGANTKENTLLALILVLMALESPIDRTVFPDLHALFAYRLIGDPATPVACGLLAVYSVFFGTMSRARIVLLAVSLGVIAALTVINALSSAAVLAPVFRPVYTFTLPFFQMPLSVVLLLPLLCVATAIPSAKPSERQRLGWIVAAFFPFFVGWTVGNFMGSSVWLAVENTSYFFIPLGLSYAALTRKTFDIGFVLNRAAVFAGVSAIVVGAFVLLEWALGQWFEGLSHASSLAINGGLALVIGVSFRVIHQYVDRTVDTIFFRKRHENETALRRFAREAAFFTGEDALVAQTTKTILEHSDVSTVRILSVGRLDPNDPAVAAMKAWQEPVDLTKRATSIEGEVAFPMIAHGALVGAIVCGAKKNGEHFAPDEMETLQMVAHGVGLARDGLTRAAPEQSDAIALIARRVEMLTRHLGIDDTLAVTE